MKVVLLCGGKGTRIREETEFRPKPMIEIGGRPLLWHIMNTYASHGLNEFVLCLGYKGNMIRDYFYRYSLQNRDFTVDLRTGDCTFHGDNVNPDWKVTLVETGMDTKTGGRVLRVAPYIIGDEFCLTYGDGLTDLNVADVLAFHRSHGKIGTVTGVVPPSRYGELFIKGDQVRSFMEKPKDTNGMINGGYFVFNRKIFDYLGSGNATVLEREPLERLAADDQLRVFAHNGFWQCMDTFRDYTYLTGLWNSGNAAWKVDTK
jgi:glucose-1-phosphate cytidylyltransferase